MTKASSNSAASPPSSSASQILVREALARSQSRRSLASAEPGSADDDCEPNAGERRTEGEMTGKGVFGSVGTSSSSSSIFVGRGSDSGCRIQLSDGSHDAVDVRTSDRRLPALRRLAGISTKGTSVAEACLATRAFEDVERRRLVDRASRLRERTRAF